MLLLTHFSLQTKVQQGESAPKFARLCSIFVKVQKINERWRDKNEGATSCNARLMQANNFNGFSRITVTIVPVIRCYHKYVIFRECFPAFFSCRNT